MTKKQNAEENYITTPISVLSYITDLEAKLAEAREEEIEFLSNLYIYEEDISSVIVVRDRLKKLKEKRR